MTYKKIGENLIKVFSYFLFIILKGNTTQLQPQIQILP